MKTLTEIKVEVDSRAAKIGASGSDSLPTYGYSKDFAYPHIEVDSKGYHYVVVERGEERSRFTTCELDELLYKIFEHVTSNLSSKYEVAHRVTGPDFRRMMFQHQVELLSQLSEKWTKQRAAELEEILTKHPFDDNSDMRGNLCKKFRAEGHSPETAWQMACTRYPLPIVPLDAR